MKVRRIAVLATGGLAALLFLASAASACFVAGTDPHVSMDPARAPAGARVSITGGNWVAETEPVAIRWGSATGAVMVYAWPDRVRNGEFSVAVTIPDAAPGVHRVYAVQPGSGTHAVVVEITKPTATNSSGSTGGGTQSTNTAVSTTGGSAPETTPASTEQEQLVPTPSTATSSSGLPVPTSAGAASPPSPVIGASPQAAGSPRPSNVTPGDVLTSVNRAENATEELPAAALVSPRSASADLWSGVSGGSPSNRIGLADLPGSSSASGPDGAVVIGMALSGLVALLGGFAVAELRRRRATVSTH